MPYTDFHYVPTGTGVISGKEVLEQTEDAINDLGQQTIAGVDQAIETANNAMNTANTANTNAQNAVNTANTAYTAATNAQNTANTAQNTASNALTAAQNAQNDVNALGNRVTTAENNIGQNTTDISGLTTRMNTAEGNITNLQNDVLTAQGTATSAQNTATLAREQAYVTRYTNTAVSDNSTVAYSDLNNTDNIKIGDFILDVNGKLYQISSVDTSNETVSVTTPLTQLALDAGVMHLSGNETATGQKTFSVTPYIYNPDNTGTTPDINFKSSKAIRGDTSGSNSDTSALIHLDKNGKVLNYIQFRKVNNGSSDITFYSYTQDSNNQAISSAITFFKAVNGVSTFRAGSNNDVNLGNASYRWKDVCTYLVNSTNPGALSLPDIINRLDISSYISDLTGQNNQYTPLVNGWICIRSANATKIFIGDSGTSIGNTAVAPNAQYLTLLCPCVAGRTVNISITCTSLSLAVFIPCQGNI